MAIAGDLPRWNLPQNNGVIGINEKATANAVAFSFGLVRPSERTYVARGALRRAIRLKDNCGFLHPLPLGRNDSLILAVVTLGITQAEPLIGDWGASKNNRRARYHRLNRHQIH